MNGLAFFIIGLSILCVAVMAFSCWKQAPVLLKMSDYFKLSISGFIAFIADTFGVGSFAVNVALSKFFGTFKDEELPGVLNGAQVLPGAIESIFFMQIVDVDPLTLYTLVAGTCLGGILGVHVVNRLSQQAIRAVMVVCFTVLALLLGLYLCGLMPLGGEAITLTGAKLGIGFMATVLCGMLTCAGVGLFVMIQSVLFVLGVSPEVAFPIMTIAGAMQQPLTTLTFVRETSLPLKKIGILSLAGCVGVLAALPIFNELSTDALRCLLLGVLLYNVISMGRAYWQQSRKSSVAFGLVATS